VDHLAKEKILLLQTRAGNRRKALFARGACLFSLLFVLTVEDRYDFVSSISSQPKLACLEEGKASKASKLPY
jgi:hypothetical protein